MKYFKHHSKWHTTPEIEELLQKHGVETYGIYFLIIEKMALHYDKENDFANHITNSSKVWANFMRCSIPKAGSHLKALSKLGLIKFDSVKEQHETMWRVEVPILQEIGDEYTQKLRRQSGQTPSKVRGNQNKNTVNVKADSGPPSPRPPGGDPPSRGRGEGANGTKRPREPEQIGNAVGAIAGHCGLGDDANETERLCKDDGRGKVFGGRGEGGPESAERLTRRYKERLVNRLVYLFGDERARRFLVMLVDHVCASEVGDRAFNNLINTVDEETRYSDGVRSRGKIFTSRCKALCINDLDIGWPFGQEAKVRT